MLLPARSGRLGPPRSASDSAELGADVARRRQRHVRAAVAGRADRRRGRHRRHRSAALLHRRDATRTVTSSASRSCASSTSWPRAAELVKGNTSRIPVAVVRGYPWQRGRGGVDGDASCGRPRRTCFVDCVPRPRRPRCHSLAGARSLARAGASSLALEAADVAGPTRSAATAIVASVTQARSAETTIGLRSANTTSGWSTASWARRSSVSTTASAASPAALQRRPGP